MTAIGGKAAGFSIHSPELGHKPLVVAAKGDRIAIGYGAPATLEGLGPAPRRSLKTRPTRKPEALGSTPITGFVDGKAALHLAEGLVPPLDSGFESARPYLDKIDYIGLGAEAEGSLATLKLIAGVEK